MKIKSFIAGALLLASAWNCAAVQIFTFTVPGFGSNSVRLYAAADGDVRLSNGVPLDLSSGPAFFTPEVDAATFSFFVDGLANRIGLAIPSAEYETTEAHFFWNNADAVPPDLIGSGVAFFRLERSGSHLVVSGHTAAVAAPDGGATAALLGLGMLGVLGFRRHVMAS